MIKINCHLADSENLIIKCNHCKIVATIIRDGPSMVALDERSNKLATIYFDDRNHRIYVEAECYPRKIIFSKRLGCNDNFFNKIPHFRLLNEICQHIDAYYENKTAGEESYNFQEAAKNLLDWYYMVNGFQAMLINKSALDRLGKDSTAVVEEEIESFKYGNDDVNKFMAGICWLFNKGFEDFEPILRDYIQNLLDKNIS